MGRRPSNRSLPHGLLYGCLIGVTASALQKACKGCVKVAGLDPRYSIHCLRHTLGTIHYARNKNLRATQKLLRHSSISSTTIYADVMEEEMRESVTGLYDG